MLARGKRCEWPSSARSLRVTSMITAGSVRGKCSASQAVHRITWPALLASHGAPQTPQNRCRARQCSIPRACARIEASGLATPQPTARRSTNLPSVSGSSGTGSSAALMSMPNTARSSSSPRNTQGPAAMRSAPAAAPEM